MRRFASLEDYAAMAGAEIGVSGWTEITQARIDAFADATRDRQWIHVDPERTMRELGGGTIAHGFLTLSLAVSFTSEIVLIESVQRAINYGTNKVRFITMVPAGARLRGRLGLTRAVMSPGCLRAVNEIRVEIEGEERPALIAETITLLYE